MIPRLLSAFVLAAHDDCPKGSMVIFKEGFLKLGPVMDSLKMGLGVKV